MKSMQLTVVGLYKDRESVLRRALRRAYFSLRYSTRVGGRTCVSFITRKTNTHAQYSNTLASHKTEYAFDICMQDSQRSLGQYFIYKITVFVLICTFIGIFSPFSRRHKIILLYIIVQNNMGQRLILFELKVTHNFGKI